MNGFKRALDVLPVLCIKSMSVLLLFLSQVLLARVCGGPSEFGDYVLWLTCLNLVVVILKAGTDTGAIRYFSKYIDTREYFLMRKYREYALSRVLALSCFFGIVVGIYCFYKLNFVHVVDRGLIILLVPAAFLLAHSQYRRGELIGGGFPIISELLESMIRPLLLIIFALLALEYGYDVNASGLAKVYVFILIFTSMSAFYLASIKLPKINKTSNTMLVDQEIILDWKVCTKGMAVNVLLRQCVKSMDILLCSVFLDSGQVAFYAVSTRLADLVVFTLSSANILFAPRISVLFSRGEKKELNIYLKNMSLFVFVIGLVLYCILVLFGERILVIYGEEYIAGYSSLIVLGLGQLVNSFFGPTGYLASMTGNQDQLTKALIFSSVLSSCAYIILIPLYGIVGAATASMLGAVSWNIIVYMRMNTLEGLKSKAF